MSVPSSDNLKPLEKLRKWITLPEQKRAFQWALVGLAIVIASLWISFHRDIHSAISALIIMLVVIVTAQQIVRPSVYTSVLAWIAIGFVSINAILITCAEWKSTFPGRDIHRIEKESSAPIHHSDLRKTSLSPDGAPSTSDIKAMEEQSSALDSPPIFGKDFFRMGGGFLKEVREEFEQLKAERVSCKKEIWIHFITNDGQLGFHGFLGLDVTAGDSVGTLPLRVKDITGEADRELHYVSWRDNEKPKMQNEELREFSITRYSFQDAFVFRFYPEGHAKSDFFVLPISCLYAGLNSPVEFESIVIMDKAEEALWNPNKYIYEIDPKTREMFVSDKVYSEYSQSDANSSKDLELARSLINTFSSTPPNFQTAKDPQKTSGTAKKNYTDCIEKMQGIIENGNFSDRCRVFRMVGVLQPKDLVLVFRFNRVN